MDLLPIALEYLAAGLCVLPATPSRKSPRLSGWKQYHKRRPTLDELDLWSPYDAICIVCGATSGNLEMIDFDGQGELYAAWRDAVGQIDAGLLDRLLIERSPSGGYHVVYRCSEGVEGNQKLAQRAIQGLADDTPVELYGKKYKPMKQPDGTYAVVLTLIETRGTGGQFLCAPTPGYAVLQGAFAQLPALTAAERSMLLQAARSLNEWQPTAPTAKPSRLATVTQGTTPGDDYNARGDVQALLTKHGWTLVGSDGDNQKWRRPGKTQGTSATFHIGRRTFYCFSSSANLPSDQGLSPFSLFARLEHGGDHSAAAAELRRQGYGQQTDPCSDVDISGLMGERGSEPEDPDEAIDSVPDPGLLPRDLLKVPGLIGDVMKFNMENAINPIPELALAGALCLQAVLVGRKVRDELDNRTNLYVIGTAPSGAGKNFARTLNRSLLYLAGAGVLEGPEDIASDAGLLSAVQAQPCILLQIDEVGRLLQKCTAKDSPHLVGIMTMLMRLFSSANTIYKGKAYADSKRTQMIPFPCLIIYGTGVPEELYEALGYTALVNGSMARLMIFEGTGSERLRAVKPQSYPPELIAAVGDQFLWVPENKLASVVGNCVTLESTPEAAAMMSEFREQCYQRTRRADSVSAAIWARCGEKAHKLALIYACSKSLLPHIRTGAPLMIEADATDWACRLAEWNTRRMLFLASRWVSSTQFEDMQKKLIRFISDKGGRATRREVMRKFHLDVRETDRLIRAMVESGQLLSEDSSRGNQIVFRLLK